MLGELLWRLPGFVGGSKRGALEELEAALAADPSYTGTYPTLAQVYLDVGRKADALSLLDRIRRVEHPADPADYAGEVADLEKALAGAQSEPAGP